MKSKLAIWSWILAIIGIIVYPGLQLIESIINIQRCGYPIFEPNACTTHIFTGSSGFVVLLSMVALALSGLIFGIVALVKISHNANQTGKINAMAGIILSTSLLLYGLFSLAGGLFA